MNSPDGDFEGFLRQFKLSPPSPLPVRQRSRGFALASVILVAAIIPTWLAWKQFTDGDATRPPVSVPSVPGTSNDIRKIERANRGNVDPLRQVRRVRAGEDGEVKPPTKIKDARPVYPHDAQAAGIQGVVILGIVIGVDGAVIETEVLRSIPELDQAAIDAVFQWEYTPTRLNDEPVEVELNVTMNFTLR